MKRGHFMGVRIAALLIVAGVSLFFAAKAKSNHGNFQTVPNNHYDWTHYDIYPSTDWGWPVYRDHHIRYRVCLGYQNIADYALWDWFNRFKINQGTTITRQWVTNCGDGSTDLLFWITDNYTVTQHCAGNQACYRPTPSIGQVVDPVVGVNVDIKGEVIVSSALLQAWSGNQGMQIHIFEHEIGHMMGMAHHGDGFWPYTNCTVMSVVYVGGQQCGYWVTANDAATSRCIYQYVC